MPGAEPAAELPPEFRGWAKEFRGRVRTWRCHWGVDEAGTPKSASYTITVTEYRFTLTGHERLTATWRSPFRADLTPDFQCEQHTAEFTAVVHGNDRTGARAVLAPPPANRPRTGWELFLADPLVPFAGADLRQAVRGAGWADRGRGRWPQPGDPAEAPVGYWASGPGGKGPDAQAVRAHLALRGPAPAGAAGLTAAGVAALDITVNAVGVRPEWEELVEASYRVLQWQSLPPAGGAPAAAVPRLAVWEERSTKPKLPGRDYYRRMLLLVDIEPDPAQRLSDIDRMLPNLKLADLRTNTPRTVVRTERDATAAWQFILAASARTDDFRKLLAADLRAAQPALFAALATSFPTPEPPGPPVGVVRTGSKFQPTTPAAAVPTKPAVTPAAETPPALLGIVDEIRRGAPQAGQGGARVPQRVGYEPVPDDRRRSAKSELVGYLAGVAVAAAAVLALFFRLRARAAPAVLGAARAAGPPAPGRPVRAGQ